MTRSNIVLTGMIGLFAASVGFSCSDVIGEQHGCQEGSMFQDKLVMKEVGPVLAPTDSIQYACISCREGSINA